MDSQCAMPMVQVTRFSALSLFATHHDVETMNAVGSHPGGKIGCASVGHGHKAAQPPSKLINRDHVVACCSTLARATPVSCPMTLTRGHRCGFS